MATHSSVLAWRIPGTGEPGGLPSMGSHRVGHNWSDLAAAAAISKDIYNYPAVKDHRKAAGSFLRTRKPSPWQTDGVAMTNGWCHHTDSMCSGASEPQDSEDLGRKGYCTKGNVEIRGLSSRHEEGRPKEFSFLNTIQHAQIPPQVTSNHFKIWNVYNFHLVCMVSSKDYLWDEIRSDLSLSRVRLSATPRIAARQASLSITNSRSSLRLTSIESRGKLFRAVHLQN